MQLSAHARLPLCCTDERIIPRRHDVSTRGRVFLTMHIVKVVSWEEAQAGCPAVNVHAHLCQCINKGTGKGGLGPNATVAEVRADGL